MVSERPTSASAALSLPVLRLDPGSVQRVSLQSKVVLYVGVHFGRRSFICAGEGCPGCDRGQSRCRGYALGLLECRDRWRPVLLEGTSAAFARLQGLSTMDGMVLEAGLLVELSRRRKNSPLRIEPIAMGGPVDTQFSGYFRLLGAIAVLFALPAPKPGQSVEEWTSATRPAVIHQLQAELNL